ncbi:MAG: DNA-binding MarR family transcriptional regulator [Paracoccaceae bacterium]|jgi:DNA-binding MarR family transcriptional regulator
MITSKSESGATARGQAGTVHPPIKSIQDALTFQLAHLVALNDRAGSHLFKQLYNLSLNEWRVLGLTYALQPVPLQEIRNILLKDKGQLSRVVRELVSRGLISNEQSPHDARSQMLSLTEQGTSLHDEVIAFTAERNEKVVSDLSREECEIFMQILQKVTRYNEGLIATMGNLK